MDNSSGQGVALIVAAPAAPLPWGQPRSPAFNRRAG